MIKYIEIGDCYQLVEDYHVKTAIRPDKTVRTGLITLTTSGDLFIKKWYAWDGPSGPTIDTKSSLRGSLVHDCLFELMRKGLLDQKWRYEADNELEQICLEDGMWEFRADVWELMVNIFGKGSACPTNRREIKTAGKDK